MGGSSPEEKQVKVEASRNARPVERGADEGGFWRLEPQNLYFSHEKTSSPFLQSFSIGRAETSENEELLHMRNSH